jgi:DNA-binding PadR family transcriptional regulator
MMQSLAAYLQKLLSDPEADDAIDCLLTQRLRAYQDGLTGAGIRRLTGFSLSRVYCSLHRLERRGYVGYSVELDKESGYKRRHYFRISPYWLHHR